MAKINCNFISYTLMRAVDITVVVPSPTFPESSMRATAEEPCAHTPKAPYPVLYLLHGGGNNQSAWTSYTNVEMYAEERNIVIVNMAAENKFFIDDGDTDYFTFISQELPDFIKGMFPVSERPEDTYIAGLSMGGFGALVHALSHPERFAAFGAFSAATSYKHVLETRPYFPADDGRYEPIALAEKIAGKGGRFPKAYLACGCQDFGYSHNREFKDKLISLGADVTWDEIEQYGHEWRFWGIEIERFLDWLPRTDVYAAQGKRKI